MTNLRYRRRDSHHPSGAAGDSRAAPSPTPSVPSMATRGGASGRRLSVLLAGLGLVTVAGGIAVVARGSSRAQETGVGWTAWVLAVVSLVATVAYLVVFTSLHLLPTGYSPVRHAVSDYAVGRYAPLFRAGLYVSSLAVLALAFALTRGVGSPPLAGRDLVYLLLVPVARIGMALFPTSLEGQRLTRAGVVHYLFAIAAFTLTYLAISEMTSVLREVNPTWWLDSPLRWTAWAVAPELALVVLTMLRPLRRAFGVVERLFLVTTNIWFILIAAVVIDLAR